MSLFPRAFASEFTPMFRLLDDYASHAAGRGSGSISASNELPSFQPKFDVKENKDSYELHGELPGVEKENLSIEFTDEHTITIKGRTEHYREEGTRPSQVAGSIEGGSVTDTTESHQYHKASVEDEDTNMSGANPEAGKSEQTQVAKSGGQQVTKHDNKQHRPRYWLMERSVGTFQRSFQFPTRVDQDNVKASMQNGILSVIVPKAAPPQSKRIEVQ